MKYVRLYTGEDQKSYFEEVDCKTTVKQELGNYSEKYPATAIQFRDTLPSATFDWHNAPEPQYIVYLQGEVEVIASGGETRIFKAGDVLLATDTTGKGHISKTLSIGKAIIIKTK